MFDFHNWARQLSKAAECPRGYHSPLGDNTLLGIFSLLCHREGMGCWAEGLRLGRCVTADFSQPASATSLLMTRQHP